MGGGVGEFVSWIEVCGDVCGLVCISLALSRSRELSEGGL